MKLFSSSTVASLFFMTSVPVLAAPTGDITFHNASGKNITAQVSTFGKFNLAANEQKNVKYSTLAQACSSNPTQCTAHFYVDDAPAGTATINAETGKLVNMNLRMKVQTSKSQQVLRSVTIQ
jgi:hypothetical protein